MFRNVKRRNDYIPYGKDWAECPRCGKRAKNKDKIEEWFGYRDMGDGRYIPQSHCRDCRIEELGKQAD